MTSTAEPSAREFVRLVEIMRRLRGPDGCPWDREQDFRSLRRYTLEEAYEVVEAIDGGDLEALCGELGDLLLQIVFLAQMASEQEAFDVAAVAASISDKLERRHPHVFGELDVEDADEVVRNWEAIKRHERGEASLLDDVPRSLPGLARAQKLGRQAAQLQFDWPDANGVLGKVREELEELSSALQSADARQAEEELGDLLFAVANLARHLGLSAEVALHGANGKFERRFRQLEQSVAAQRVHPDLDALEQEWQRIKRRERVGTAAIASADRERGDDNP